MEEIRKINIRTILLFGSLIVFLMGMISLWAWFQIPDGTKIPVHWGADGQPNRYGDKWEGLFLMPCITLGLVLLFAAIPYLEPRKLHFNQSSKAYAMIIYPLMLFMLAVHIGAISAAMGSPLDISDYIPILVGILFLLIGNVMGKIRSNFFMGIRTPWTLSSELSWRKTHRLGGWLFVMFGVVLILSTLFLPKDWQSAVLMGGIITVALIPIVYSYIIWRSDPQRERSDSNPSANA